MLVLTSTLLPLLLATASSALTLPPSSSTSSSTTTIDKRDPNNNFYAGNCVFYWVPDLLENTPMNIRLYDAMQNLLLDDTTTPLPAWSDNEAHVLIYELDRWVGIQSQPDNRAALFAYGSNTRIHLDPTPPVLGKINTTFGEYGDMPNLGECAWALPNDSIIKDSTDLMKCAFSCGPGY